MIINWPTKRTYLSGITLRTIYPVWESYPQNGGENQLAEIWNEITPQSPYVYTLSPQNIHLVFLNNSAKKNQPDCDDF